MANRRRPDTSALFTSLATPSSENASGKISEKEPGKDVGASVEAHATDAGAATKNRKKQKKPRKPKIDDPMDRQSVKLGFYLTPRVYEAIQLHKTVNFIGVHNDSQIINKALTEYLAKEIAVLRDENPKKTSEERLRSASAKLIADTHS